MSLNPRTTGTCDKDGSAHPRRKAVLCALLLSAVTLTAYWGVGDNGFVNFDDHTYLTQNDHIARGLTWDGVRWAFTEFYTCNWHPVTWLSHMLDVQMFDMHPRGHHLVSLGFHLANTLLLFGFLFYTTGRPWAGAFVAALFALHPLHVESVAWASERKDVLSTFFWLATMWIYAGYARKPGTWRYLAVLALYACGLMSKPMLVTLPLVLLMLDYWPLERASSLSSILTRRLLMEKLPFLAMAAASSIVTMWAQQGAIATFQAIPLSARLANAAVSYWRYMLEMLWPANLAPLYPFHVPDMWLGSVAAILLALATVLLVRAGIRFKYVAVGWLWYLVTLVPVIGVVQVGEQAHADRYTYVPLTGIFLVVAWSLGEVLKRKPALRSTVAIAAILVLLVSAGLTQRQVAYWKDTCTLATRAAAVTKDNVRMLTLLATSYIDLGNYDEAAARFGQLLQIDPDNAAALSGMGVVCLRTGRYEASIDYCLKAVAVKPELKENLVNAATACQRMGRKDQAEKYLRKAVEVDPKWALAYGELARLVGESGRTDEAISYYKKGLELDPWLQLAHVNLGLLEAGKGDFASAAAEFRRQLEVKPDAETWSYLGGALAELNKLDEAACAYAESIRLEPRSSMSHHNLGVVLARMGRKAEAARELEKAMSLDPGDAGARSYYNQLMNGQ